MFYVKQVATLLLNRTCKYSVLTLTCQAVDNGFILGAIDGSHYGIELEQIAKSYTAAFPNLFHFRLKKRFLAPCGQ